MVIDAHLKHVNGVNNMKGKKYTFALHMKCGGFKIKTVLIIVHFIINNPELHELYLTRDGSRGGGGGGGAGAPGARPPKIGKNMIFLA